MSDRDQALIVGIAREAGGACAAVPGALGRLCEAAQPPAQSIHSFHRDELLGVSCYNTRPDLLF